MTLLHQAAQKAVEALTSIADFDQWNWSDRETVRQMKVIARAALESAALQQQPEPAAQIDESKLPPRPAGHNGPDTDPDSPLVRYGRAKPESGVLLEPMDDGYWTPWHIANEMLRSALQHQEVPREPVAVARPLTSEEEENAWNSITEQGCSCCTAAVRLFCRLNGITLSDAVLATSPSTTRQQEVGSAACQHQWLRDKEHPRHYLCKKCGTARDGRLGVPAAPSTPEKAGGVSDGVDALGEGQR